jgi:Zn-dependent protease with chaperone function
MNALGAAQLLALAGLMFAVLAGLVVSAVTPGILAHVRTWAPRPRHRVLVLVSIAPVLLAMTLVLAAVVPSLVPLVWPEHDHCLAHDDGHLHMCAVHLPHQLGNGASWIMLMLGLAWCAVRLYRALAKLRRASRIAAGLLAHGRQDAESGAVVLATTTPLCLLVGVRRPVVVLSEGLLAGLSASSVAVVLRHERAHARRRDTLVRLVAWACTAFMRRSVRTRLLDALELAAEQSCDEIAAESLGRVHVAEAILGVERMMSARSSELRMVAAFFGGHAVQQRIAALLDEPRPERRAAVPALALVMALGLVLAASEPLHHLTESLLGALVH